MTLPPLRLTVAATVLLTACAENAGDPPSAPPVPEARSEMVEVAGSELYLRSVGDGPPVVVVHGGPMLDHGYLYGPLLPLASEHELVFFDQRVSGRSAATTPDGSMSINRLVDDIEAIRIAQGHERVDLLGHSWGGFLAALYAARYPERVRHLVLVSPMAPTSDLRFQEEMAQRGAMRPEDAAAMEEVRTTEAFREQRPDGIEAMLRASFRNSFVNPEFADSLDFEIPDDYAARSALFGEIFPELESYDVRDELDGITARTLVVYGEEESSADIGGTVWRAAIPGASLSTILGAGHFSFIEQRFDFMDRVDVFLDSGR